MFESALCNINREVYKSQAMTEYSVTGYSPKPLLDQRRSRRVGTRLPPGILVDEIRSHRLLGDKSYFVPKFQEGYTYKHAARGMTIKFSSLGNSGMETAALTEISRHR